MLLVGSRKGFKLDADFRGPEALSRPRGLHARHSAPQRNQRHPNCRLTNRRASEEPALLRASHIKPWRVCDTAHERLDGFNGLMLAPHVDFLFDRGLICFEDDGRVLFSSRLADADARKLGLHQVERPPRRPFRGESNSYFQHHRTNVFIS